MIIQGKAWGETSPLFNKNNVEVHFIKIKKGGFCSRHKHKHKFNKFIVIDGSLKITAWKDYAKTTLEDVTVIESNQECTIPPGEYHKFEALKETTALEIYWVELSENDIERADVGGCLDATNNPIGITRPAGEEFRRDIIEKCKQAQAAPQTTGFVKF